MVFIVKIPNHNRSRGATPDPSSEPSDHRAQARSDDGSSAAQRPKEPSTAGPKQPQDPPSLGTAAAPEPTGNDLPRASTGSTQAYDPVPASKSPPTPPPPPPLLPPTSSSSSSSTAQLPAALDILLAPAVLNHRYVRGVDKSLIVERPERIRAVLLGIAGAIGKHAEQDPLAAADDADDLVSKLSSLSVGANRTSSSGQTPPFRVLHSTRSLALHPPHPSVGYVHAHSEEVVQMLESSYYEAKKRRQQARQTKLEAEQHEPTIRGNASAGDGSGSGGGGGGRNRGRTETDQQASPASTSHASYVSHLASRAPSAPPLSRSAGAAAHDSKAIDARSSSSRSTAASEESEDYTSSDGEGDEAMHPSEIPEHLPQGDLYLAGPTNDADEGGSSQAIRHAMGACAEAVDRVVAAARIDRLDGSTGPGTAPATAARALEKLPELRYDANFSEQTEEASAASPRAALPARRAFVLSRPPGHHCAGSSPSGFCWVNNAVVAAAHGYLNHGIDRVVIFDIDLHHGNGTQALAWRINADSQRSDLDREARLAELRASAIERNRATIKSASRGRGHGAAAASLVDEKALEAQVEPRGLRIFYGSIHDIESFPCEDGDPDLIRDASVCVEGAHGQWIWNVHLDHYSDEDDFHRLYDERYSVLFAKAARFLQNTAARPESTLVLISAGFDACSYEYAGMQRHGKHVPPSFYDRFARDSIEFAEQWGEGKVVSVLEGGYSDRALCSAAMAHVIGLAQIPPSSPSSGPVASGLDQQRSARPRTTSRQTEDAAWKLENLVHLEKMAKKMAAAAAAVGAGTSTPSAARRRGPEPPAWVSRSSRAFAAFERCCGKDGIVPLGFPSPSGAAAAAAQAKVKTAAASSAASSPGGTVTASGRVLRDRSALKQRAAWDPSSPSSSGKGTGVTSPRTTRKTGTGTVPSAPAAGVSTATGTVGQPETPLPSSDAGFAPSSPTEGRVPQRLQGSTDHGFAVATETRSGPPTAVATQIKQEHEVPPRSRTPPTPREQTPGAASNSAATATTTTAATTAAPSAEATVPTAGVPPPSAPPLGSRIGSVTPKAAGLQATPVMLVDALSAAFASSASISASPPPHRHDGARRDPDPSATATAPFLDDGDGVPHCFGAALRNSSLGLAVPDEGGVYPPGGGTVPPAAADGTAAAREASEGYTFLLADGGAEAGSSAEEEGDAR